jgi:hypothetical protein
VMPGLHPRSSEKTIGYETKQRYNTPYTSAMYTFQKMLFRVSVCS